MRVSIVALTESERTAHQCRFFTTGGHTCQIYVQEQPQARTSAEAVLTTSAFLELEHVRDTALFLFHYASGPYPLLEAMRYLRHGLVVLDLCGVERFEQVPAHYADLCLVADAAQKRTLIEATGYVPERIYTLPAQQDDEMDKLASVLELILNLGLQGDSPRPAEKTPITEADVHRLPGSDIETTLLIRDPTLDQAAILDRVRQGIQRRLAVSDYGADVATPGPEVLRPGLSGDDDADQMDMLLLRLQVALYDLTRSRLQEPAFHSSVPVMGPLIVAVRRFWNWMSTKWYVRDWMAQQARFNAQVVDVASQILQIQENNEQRIRELELRLAQTQDKVRSE